MTCIVGLVDGKSIFMGADCAGVAGSNITLRKDPKVFIKDNMIFGFTSSFRMGDLLRYKLEIPKHPKGMSDRRYMVSCLVESVRKCLKDGGMASAKDGEETGGTFLIGYNNKIFEIDSDYQVGMSIDKYNSVGSGSQIALGSMYSSNGKPVDRIKKALKAAEKYTTGVRGPFLIKSI